MNNCEPNVVQGDECLLYKDRMEEDSFELATNSRQEEGHFSIESLRVIEYDRREYKSQLTPRLSSLSSLGSLHVIDDDLSLCETFENEAPSVFKNFSGQNPFPAIPASSASSTPRENPELLRSMAWSQDSEDEVVHLSKRRKEDEQISCWSQHQSSPTTVHWEEKISGPMDLTNIVERAINVSNTKRPKN